MYATGLVKGQGTQD